MVDRPTRIARPGSRSTGRRRALWVATLTATMLLTAAPAGANVGETIIDRCTHGESLSGFNQSAYTQALKELSADTEEYSDCSSLIRQAQRAAAVGARGGGDSSGGGPTAGAASSVAVAATPSEQRAVTHAAQGGSEPVQLGGQAIAPGVVHANVSSALSSLPTPLLAFLGFLLACALAIVGGVLRRRVRGARSA
jgi:hypothetical protein